MEIARPVTMEIAGYSAGTLNCVGMPRKESNERLSGVEQLGNPTCSQNQHRGPGVSSLVT